MFDIHSLESNYLPCSHNESRPSVFLANIFVGGRGWQLLPKSVLLLCKQYCWCTVMSHFAQNICLGRQSAHEITAYSMLQCWHSPFGGFPPSSMPSRSWGLALRHFSFDNTWRTVQVFVAEHSARLNVSSTASETVSSIICSSWIWSPF